MPFNVLGKVMFPRQQRSERTRRAKMVVGIVFVSLVLGGCLGVLLYLQNAHQK